MYKLDREEKDLRENQRGQYDDDSRWYALMVHVGRERQVSAELASAAACAAIEEYLLPEYAGPAAEAGDRARLLFAGYIFIRCRMSDEIYAAVAEQRAVYKILGRAWRIPSPVADDEIGLLQAVLKAYERPELVRALGRGDVVEVGRGLMAGMRGRVLEVNQKFVKLETSFSFLSPGTGIAVLIPRSDLKLELHLP